MMVDARLGNFPMGSIKAVVFNGANELSSTVMANEEADEILLLPRDELGNIIWDRDPELKKGPVMVVLHRSYYVNKEGRIVKGENA